MLNYTVRLIAWLGSVFLPFRNGFGRTYLCGFIILSGMKLRKGQPTLLLSHLKLSSRGVSRINVSYCLCEARKLSSLQRLAATWVAIFFARKGQLKKFDLDRAAMLLNNDVVAD
jgi:hypothetical protein